MDLYEWMKENRIPGARPPPHLRDWGEEEPETGTSKTQEDGDE